MDIMITHKKQWHPTKLLYVTSGIIIISSLLLALAISLMEVVQNIQVLAQQEQQEQNASSSNITTTASTKQGPLQNSTSFGELGSDSAIKHPPELSTLTVKPWPIVKSNENLTASGRVIDKVTLAPIAEQEISFLYESASSSIPPESLDEIKPQKTDAMGSFKVDFKAPERGEGVVSVTALFNGTDLHHAAASPPALVMVSNTTMAPSSITTNATNANTTSPTSQ
jgi:hypothetical protein